MSQTTTTAAGSTPDRTDTLPADMRTEDSTAIHPLGRTCDPVLIYGGAVPAGVRYVGIESQGGILAILDGPGNTGSPVVNARVRGFVQPLLTAAKRIPGAHGIVIAVATQQVYAVSMAALDSIITRQAMPQRREATALDKAHEMAAYVPTRIFVVAAEGRRYACDPRPIARIVSFTGFLLAIAATMIGLAMVKKLSLEPIYQWLSTTPGVSVLDTPAFGFSLAGTVFTMAMLLSYAPAIVQVLGMLFSRSRMLGVYAFWTATSFDCAINTQFWYKVIFTTRLDGLEQKYGAAVSALANIGAVCFSVFIALVNSIGAEGGIVLFIALAVALWPGFIAAMGGAIEAMVVRTPIRIFYAAKSLTQRTGGYLDTQRAQYELPSADPIYVVIDPQEGGRR
jgi:hypothetical protein